LDLFNTVYFGVLHFEKYSKGRILETLKKKTHTQYSVGIKINDSLDKFLFKILLAVKREPADCLDLAGMIWKVEMASDWL